MTVLEAPPSARRATRGALVARLTGAAARRVRLPEAAVVVAILVALECLVFWGYFSGTYAPPWDFMGSYNTDAYAWWSEGSFFHPAEWISHAWGGYPAAASIQNSAWYLPVGIVTLFTPFTIHASAALAALHYGFGALGVYGLGRAFRLGRIPATFGLVAYFFVSGFYAQAEHVDIARGYAWLPWILLCTSPRWPWRRWWAVPVATLVLWQALLGTYPGIIVAALYCVAVWVLVQQLTSRSALRSYLIPLAFSGAVTVMLLAPKYIPALLLDAASSVPNPDASKLSWSVLATAFLPYGNPTIPNDIALRSFFLPATAFVLVGLVSVRSALGRAAVAVLATAVVLGMPRTPWHDAVSHLPGMTLSRFRMSDFRSFMLLATCLLAMVALARLVRTDTRIGPLRDRRTAVRAAWLVLVPTLVLVLAVANSFDPAEWALPLLIVTAACTTVWLGYLPLPETVGEFRLGRRPAALVLVALTAISGVASVYATPAPWRSPRGYAETVSFGDTVDNLVAEDTHPTHEQQRPGRSPIADPADPAKLMTTLWNAGFYDGTDSVGGLVNLKRSPSFDALRAALLDPAVSADVNYLFSAPGIVVELVGGQLPDRATVTSCVDTGSCGADLSVTADGYEPGHLDYVVDARTAELVALNEAYYLGWRVSACPTAGGACQDLQAIRGPVGTLAMQLPAGDWHLSLDYVPPGSQKAWWAFWVGAGALALWAVGAVVLHLVRVRRRRRPQADPHDLGDSPPVSSITRARPIP